ncbi:Ferredoxin [Halobacillus karajensis]|uniref:Na(+)-translocating NADH-quinone reductase subunit F n=1 Tax=Halobacillus karajensis TaxID=195088 RepID=A0A024P7C4_9BACI|nr:2Fe-2S iron-sulfur cluster-binding protein [Halobacillus karajensis]CDQ18204.1 Na(+)-translocating NADH-quinone reductase subunit F [Halobacillus karajensis]CDQ24556.1 Na(+)-translocating NADH-quinone reductase subunit F [Halobacillus karajensis]CDQ29197.1 Na(+)-translocating NADH-quinone reductase subunit F [Halobacillus karajensis]SEH57270.1 Ferredoxin [Halobacillus karajensis]
MPKVTIPGEGTFEVEKGKKLVLALEDNGIKILHQCGGRAKCTTCRVEVLEGEFCDLSNIEQEAFASKGIEGIFEDNLRLSCQVRVEGDITVRPMLTVERTGKKTGPRPSD